MTVTPQSIPDLLLITPRIFTDNRGYFKETWQASAMPNLGIPPFVQDNESCSRRHVLRGLHYQISPHAQGKLVRVVCGAVWDVAVDIRPDSTTYGQWSAVTLTAENHQMLWIPPGFAHGFVTLTDNTIFVYKCTAPYNPSAERGICWNDPTLKIDWPVTAPVVSAKDTALPPLSPINA
ncbi:MAG: dTDP-4-dehydrorhamnose 3,5-epimerase [Lentisphaerae bacterium]|nr:dTDP-4-dehydrorhamnose 3,5-epimerase [Lentisphaerota bacterium]